MDISIKFILLIVLIGNLCHLASSAAQYLLYTRSNPKNPFDITKVLLGQQYKN
jgi:hypothetical protein